MQSRKVTFKTPLALDIAKLASYFPEFRYRGPIEKPSFGDAITSEYIVNDASSEKCQVLFFDGKTDDGFNTVLSAYSPKELAVLFSRLPTEMSDPLVRAFKGTSLEIPTVSEREYKEINEEQEKQKIRQQRLLKLKKPLTGTSPVDFKPEEAFTVLQHEYALTKSSSNQTVLGTFGAGPCLILALYDSKNKIAILAHIDSMTNVFSLAKLFDLVSKEHTVAHLAGGDSSSQDFCIDIIELIEDNNIKISNADIVREGSFFDSASLAIDARTGAIYSDIEPAQLHQTTDMNFRLQMAGMQFCKSPLKNCYNGLNEKSSLKIIKESTVDNIDSKNQDKGQSSRITLGFIDNKKQPKNNQDTYCGFKKGFLSHGL